MARSRHNRVLTALHDHPGLPVFGIGESTALVVEPEGMSVEGSGQVVVFSPSQSSGDTAGNIRIDATTVTVLVAGDRWHGK